MPEEFTVRDMKRLPSADPGRLGKLDVLVVVQYTAGGHDVVRLPAETFSEQALKDAVKKLLAEKAPFVGRKFSV